MRLTRIEQTEDAASLASRRVGAIRRRVLAASPGERGDERTGLPSDGLRRGAISRREFLARAASLGVSAALVATAAGGSGACRRDAEEGRPAAPRPGRRRRDATASIPRAYDGSRDDRGRPRPIQRARGIIGGRQARAGARGELGGREPAPPNGCSTSARASNSPTARNSPRTMRSILSICIAARRSRALSSDEAGHRHQEARQIPDPDHARRRPTPISPASLTDHRLPMVPDGFQGLVEAGRHRRLCPRQIRARRAHRAQESERRLLEGGPRPSRRRRNHRHRRRRGAARTRWSPVRSTSSTASTPGPPRLLAQGAQDRNRARAGRLASRSWRWRPTSRLTTIRISGWR